MMLNLVHPAPVTFSPYFIRARWQFQIVEDKDYVKLRTTCSTT